MKSQLQSKTIIIKVGSSTLSTDSSGHLSLDREVFRRIAGEALDLQEEGYNIIIVSSAAITAGLAATNQSSRPSDIPSLQMLASIGWRHVLEAWANSFEDREVGEILITRQNLDSKRESREVIGVISSLLSHGHIAIVNENDAISHEEIAFGDNDNLAATLASALRESEEFPGEVTLLILSDINGVYRDVADPESVIRFINSQNLPTHLIKESTGGLGTGGMTTKFRAVKTASSSGVTTYLGNGKHHAVVRRTLTCQDGTCFYTNETELLGTSTQELPTSQ